MKSYNQVKLKRNNVKAKLSKTINSLKNGIP